MPDAVGHHHRRDRAERRNRPAAQGVNAGEPTAFEELVRPSGPATCMPTFTSRDGLRARSGARLSDYVTSSDSDRTSTLFVLVRSPSATLTSIRAAHRASLQRPAADLHAQTSKGVSYAVSRRARARRHAPWPSRSGVPRPGTPSTPSFHTTHSIHIRRHSDGRFRQPRRKVAVRRDRRSGAPAAGWLSNGASSAEFRSAAGGTVRRTARQKSPRRRNPRRLRAIEGSA
jgi:hypothetical protein